VYGAFEEDVMARHFKTHIWHATAIGLAVTVALMAACGGSAKPASNKPAAGQPPGGTDSGAVAKSIVNGSASTDSVTANNAQVQSGELAPAPGTDATIGGSPGGGAPSTLPSTLDRKIIQTATLTIETDNVAGKFEDVRTVASAYGGFVASSTFGNSGDRQTAAITISVPGDAYERALNDLRKLGDVKGEQSGANDVTEQFTDLQSRLRNLQATEAQYVEFLLRAQNIQDVLTVQDRLNATRAEIEQVQGRINLVAHQTDLATITVHLDPPVVAKTDKPKTSGGRGPLEVAADSFQASLDVLLGIATVALAVAAFSWWLVPLAVVGALLGRRQLRAGRPRQPIGPPAAPAV
jgi:hypothetical protein